MSSPPEREATAVDRVLESLRGDILAGRYRPGDRLPSERDLSVSLGVHRGAVREGLRSLAHLGLVEVRPGGARVGSLDDASVDLVSHLLELDAIPDATLVSQMLEVHAHLFSSCVRMAIERGSDEDLARARAHLLAIQSEVESDGAYLDRLDGFVDVLVEASGNVVLRLMRKALRPRMLGSLDQERAIVMRLPREVMLPLSEKLGAALAARDAMTAEALVYELFDRHRERAEAALTQEQQRSLRGSVTDHLTRLLQTPSTS